MDASTAASLASNFLQAVGELVADLKRRELAEIDLDLLRLKRDELRRKLEDLKCHLAESVIVQKAKTEQSLLTRGLSNSTIRDGMLRAIEQDANGQMERAVREYNLVIAELALTEQRIKANARPLWKRLLQKAPQIPE
jgi:hypothetical protein